MEVLYRGVQRAFVFYHGALTRHEASGTLLFVLPQLQQLRGGDKWKMNDFSAHEKLQTV